MSHPRKSENRLDWVPAWKMKASGDQGYDAEQTEHDDYGSHSVRIPTNSPDKWRIKPHAEFIERQTDPETVEHSDPFGRSRTFEDQGKITGHGENQNAIHIMMDVQARNGFPVYARKQQAEESRNAYGQCEGRT